MVASIVANLVDAHVERQLNDAFTVPDQFTLGLDGIGLIGSVTDRRSRNHAFSEPARRPRRGSPANRPSVVYYTGSKPEPLRQVDETSHEEDEPIYLHSTFRDRKSSHRVGDDEDLNGIVRRRDDAGGPGNGEEGRDKRNPVPLYRQKVPMNSTYEEHSCSGDDKRRRKRKKKIKLKKKHKSRNHSTEGDSKDDSKSSESEVSSDGERKRLFGKRRKSWHAK